MKSTMRRRDIFLTVVIALIPLGALLSAMLVIYQISGVIRTPNALTFSLIVALACLGLGSWSLCALFFTLGGLIFKQKQLAFNGLVGLLAGLASLAIGYASVLPLRIMAERADLDSVGLNLVRQEAGTLVQRYSSSTLPTRWFGVEVPTNELPDGIKKLSKQAVYVTTSSSGVVMVTDGMGSWRGGYLIIPQNSTYFPEKGRKIADGVYYITAH